MFEILCSKHCHNFDIVKYTFLSSLLSIYFGEKGKKDTHTIYTEIQKKSLMLNAKE